MKWLNKCTSSRGYFPAFLFALLLSSLLVGLSPLASQANATTVYDGIIDNVEEIQIYNPETSADIPLSLTWRDDFLAAMTKRCDYFGGSFCTQRDSFANNVPSSSPSNKWGLVQENASRIAVLWTTDATNTCGFEMMYGEPSYIPAFYCGNGSGSLNKAIITSNGNCSNTTIRTDKCLYQEDDGQSTMGKYYIPENSTKKPWFLNFDINYPLDYAGQGINQTYTPPAQPVVYKPTIEGTVNNLHLDLFSTTFLFEEEPPFDNIHVKYLIAEGDVGCNPLTMECEALYFLEGNVPLGTHVQAKLPKKAIYYVQAQLTDVSGNPLEDNETMDFQIAERRLDVDGSTYSFATQSETCDEYGNCEPLPATGGNAILQAINALVIDNYGLQDIINAPLGFLSNLSSFASNCTPIQMTLPYLNTDADLQCLRPMYQTSFPTLLAIWQTVLTGLTAYWVAIKVFSTIKNISSPDDDRIEVAQL